MFKAISGLLVLAVLLVTAFAGCGGGGNLAIQEVGAEAGRWNASAEYYMVGTDASRTRIFPNSFFEFAANTLTFSYHYEFEDQGQPFASMLAGSYARTGNQITGTVQGLPGESISFVATFTSATTMLVQLTVVEDGVTYRGSFIISKAN